MGLFAEFPTYWRYRTLQRTDPILKGEDVYALQTALNSTGFGAGAADGAFGPMTETAVRSAQRQYGLIVDGKAGQKTQTALAMELSNLVRGQFRLPLGLPDGQLRHESGCFLGNYSPVRTNGSYDAGVAQRNTDFTPAKEGFTVPTSIAALAKNTRLYFDKYAKVADTRRRWELAAGSWNAPAFANQLAYEAGATDIPRAERAVPGETARKTFEAYIASACAYLKP